MPSIKPIAVDPAYQLRDNQFWYSKSRIAPHVQNQSRITIHIEGLGERTLTHAAVGKDGRPTKSFTLPYRADREWWTLHRGHTVRIELLAIGNERPSETINSSVKNAAPRAAVHPAAPPPKRYAFESTIGSIDSVLCIGLDIAWFGGSAKNPDSQYDCLAAVHMQSLTKHSEQVECKFARIKLEGRDPDAKHLLQGIADLLKSSDGVGRVVLAIDAPIQAADRAHLPARKALSSTGEIEWRACEKYFSDQRKTLDKAAGGSDGWQPNIQPGAPLAPRVICLLEGLGNLGFVRWTPQDHAASRVAIECFPAEAIWAAKRLGCYSDALALTQVKAYKNQDKNRLKAELVSGVVHNALDAFAAISGNSQVWTKVLETGLSWLLADETWRASDPGFYKGGKLLDDVVDSVICLATSLSYVHGQTHVWHNPNHADDGHIIGPGRLDRLSC